jgi:peroxiredoxin
MGRDLFGMNAVAFELQDAKGRVHRLNDYRGGWLLMVFHRHLA